MPYLKGEQRPALEVRVEALTAAIEELPPEQREGAFTTSRRAR